MPRDPENLRAWRQANRARIREQHRAYLLRHKDDLPAKRKEYYDRHAEHICAQARARRQRDPEAYRAYQRAYYQAHPEEHRAKARQHYAKHRTTILTRIRTRKRPRTEQIRARNRADSRRRRILHPERIASRIAAWAKAHPERRALTEMKRRAKKRAAPVNDLTTTQGQTILAMAKGVCAYCQVYNPTCTSCRRHSHKLTLDHIIPLVSGGHHTLSNLVACCRSCNSKKGRGLAPLAVQPLLL